jgi:hypothetical protein
VIGLSLSLMVGGGRRAAIRLLLIVAGVAAGTVFLLGALAIGPARDRADARVTERQGPVGAPLSDNRSALLWAAFQTGPSEIGGRGLEVVEVAATGLGAPRPLGAVRTPAPGEVFVSPALGRLLESDRGRVYRLRFPGRIDGTLGRAVLHDPDELVAMVGMAPDRLAGATRITDWAAAQPPSEAQTGNTFNRRLVYLLAALAVLIPIVVFVAASTRIGATMRERGSRRCGSWGRRRGRSRSPRRPKRRPLRSSEGSRGSRSPSCFGPGPLTSRSPAIRRSRPTCRRRCGRSGSSCSRPPCSPPRPRWGRCGESR